MTNHYKKREIGKDKLINSNGFRKITNTSFDQRKNYSTSFNTPLHSVPPTRGNTPKRGNNYTAYNSTN